MGRDTEFEYGWNVTDHDPPTYEAFDQGKPDDVCMGQVFCERCKKYHGCCAEVQNFSTYQGENNMIQRDKSPRNGKGRINGLNFLTTKETTRTPQPAKVIAARVQPDNFKPGNQVVAIRVEFRGQHWLLNLRPNNPNLDTLCDAWGDDESRWGGRMMMIHSDEDMFDGKVWMHLDPNVVAPEPEKPEITKGRK